MGIRSFLAENKKARQERREGLSWWNRKKHYEDESQMSWTKPIGTMDVEAVIEENKRIYEDEMTRPLRDTSIKGVTPTLEINDEIYTPEWLAANPDFEVTSRYDIVPSYAIPHAMIALKGAPTNNVGRFLEWRAKQNG